MTQKRQKMLPEKGGESGRCGTEKQHQAEQYAEEFSETGGGGKLFWAEGIAKPDAELKCRRKSI